MTDTKIYYYQHPTQWGVVSLMPEARGFYKIIFEGKHFGSYSSLEHAIDDIAGGHTHTPSSGIDFDKMGISDDLDDWNKKLFATFKKMRAG